MQPLVSILIPAYNAEAFIAQTLDSALNQTWKNKEIIVVDDGSTDRTLAVAQRFRAQGVVIAQQQNQGASAARNYAFSLCQGDYIQWLDADDLLSRDKIESQMSVAAVIGDRRLLFSSGWASFRFRSHKATSNSTKLWQDLTPSTWLKLKLEHNLHMQTATWLVSRELTESAGNWNTRLLSDDDGEYFCRVIMASTGIKFSPKGNVFYRDTGPASLGYIGSSQRKIDAHFASMQLHIKYLRALDDGPEARAACVRYLQTSAAYFYPERMDIFASAQAMATELGGRLEEPTLSWKYSWIQKTVGWTFAKRTQIWARHWRWAIPRTLDKILARLEGFWS
jgi:glycosyltransferase involved in cell wall biosynthesis